MSSYRNEAREGTQAGCFGIPLILMIGAALIIVALASSAAYYGTLPFFLHQEAVAQRASPQYVEAKRQEMLELVAASESPTVTEGQRRANLNKIREDKALIPQEDVPSSVNRYLAANGG